MRDSVFLEALRRGILLGGGMAMPYHRSDPFPWEAGPPAPIGDTGEIMLKCDICRHEYATDLLCPWPCPECGQEQWPAPHDQREAIAYYYSYADDDALTIDVLRLHRGYTWGLAFGHTNTGRPKFVMLRGDAYESAGGATEAALAAEPILRDWQTWIQHGTVGVGGWRLDVMPLGEGRRHRWFLHRGDAPLCMGPIGWNADDAGFTVRTLRHALEKRNGVIEPGVSLAPCFDWAVIERRRLEREAWFDGEAERLTELLIGDLTHGKHRATYSITTSSGVSLYLCELCARHRGSGGLRSWYAIEPTTRVLCHHCEARRADAARLRHNQEVDAAGGILYAVYWSHRGPDDYMCELCGIHAGLPKRGVRMNDKVIQGKHPCRHCEARRTETARERHNHEKEMTCLPPN